MSLSIVAAIQVINWFIESHKSRCLWTIELRIVIYVTYAETFGGKKMQNAVSHFSSRRWFVFRLKAKRMRTDYVHNIISNVFLFQMGKAAFFLKQLSDFFCVQNDSFVCYFDDFYSNFLKITHEWKVTLFITLICIIF